MNVFFLAGCPNITGLNVNSTATTYSPDTLDVNGERPIGVNATVKCNQNYAFTNQYWSEYKVIQCFYDQKWTDAADCVESKNGC